MTAYFDDYARELAKLADPWRAATDAALKELDGEKRVTVRFPYDELQALERKIVWDVTLAAESPGMPDHLRDAIHAVIIKHAVEDRPVNDQTHPTVQTEEDYLYEMSRLGGELHSIFHVVAHEGGHGFSDSPISPLRVLYARGDERREGMVATRKGEVKS